MRAFMSALELDSADDARTVGHIGRTNVRSHEVAAGVVPRDPAVLRQSADSLEARLRAQLSVFEARYELPSAELDAALGRGDIRETAEVAAWIVAFRTWQG